MNRLIQGRSRDFRVSRTADASRALVISLDVSAGRGIRHVYDRTIVDRSVTVEHASSLRGERIVNFELHERRVYEPCTAWKNEALCEAINVNLRLIVQYETAMGCRMNFLT